MFCNGSKFYSTNNYIASGSWDCFLYAVPKWFQSSKEDINSEKKELLSVASCRCKEPQWNSRRSIELKPFSLPIWPTKGPISWLPPDVAFPLILFQWLASLEQLWWLEKVSPFLSLQHFSPVSCCCLVASGSPGGMCTLGRLGSLLCRQAAPQKYSN